MFIIIALIYAAGLYQFLLQNLFNFRDAYPCEGLSVDDNRGPLAAAVHATRPAENHLVVEVILPQIIPDNLHYLPVTS